MRRAVEIKEGGRHSKAGIFQGQGGEIEGRVYGAADIGGANGSIIIIIDTTIIDIIICNNLQLLKIHFYSIMVP